MQANSILSAQELTMDPDDVFSVVGKLGEGSYGSVHKGVHKRTGQIVAIKRIPVENDLEDSLKEISVMTGCESYYVVAFYGSYLKDNYLWIVMEYCAAGSVSDIMNLCHKTLDEGQIAVVCKYVLHGLAYLHSKRKIHRDIKAGNILINDGGEAKLADFGVAGQLTDNMSKRNTVIGTPFWMAPEVIQEVGYGVSADIWSLGITCIEMADGRPPYHNIHPMRAIFMIPTKPPPKLEDETKFSAPFRNFIARCLTKDPKERPTAETLMADPFITSAPGLDAVGDIVKETLEAIAKGGLEDRKEDDDDDDETSGGSDGRDEAAARALRGEAPVARPRERGARPVSRQNARRRSKTPGGGRSDDDGDMTIKLGKGEAPAASRGGAATDSSGAVSPTSPPGGRGLEPGRSDGEDDGGTITMGMAGRLAGAWSVSQVAGSRDSGTIVLGRGLQASSSSGSISSVQETGTMVLTGANDGTARVMGNSSSDTYQPDFMKHIRQQQQYSAPPPSVTASTSAPPTSSVSTPYHEDMSGMDTIKPAARTPSTVSSPNSAAVAAADAAIAAAKRKLPQSASVSQSSGAKVGNPVLSPPVPRQSRQASDGSLPPAPQQEKPVPPAPHPTMLPRAQSTSVDDLRELLGELEANMEREIQATRLRYEIRKAPILDAILAKGGRLPFKEGIPERRGAASKEG